jgi:hypothetical protein
MNPFGQYKVFNSEMTPITRIEINARSGEAPNQSLNIKS